MASNALTNLELEELIQLRDKCEEQEEKIALLYRLLLPEELDFGSMIGLTKHESKVLTLLLKARGLPVTRDRMYDVMYQLRHADEIPDMKIIDVLTCKLRAKVKKWDIKIETVWGRGYCLPIEDARNLLAIKNMTLEDLDKLA